MLIITFKTRNIGQREGDRELIKNRDNMWKDIFGNIKGWINSRSRGVSPSNASQIKPSMQRDKT